MRRHLEGLGVPTAGMSRREAGRVQRELHRRSRAGLATYRQLHRLVADTGGLSEWDGDRLRSIRRDDWRGALEAAVAEHRAAGFLASGEAWPETSPVAKANANWQVLLACVQKTRRTLAFRLAAAGHNELTQLVGQVSPADIEAMVHRGDREELDDVTFLRKLDAWMRSRIRDESTRLPEAPAVTEEEMALHRSRCDAHLAQVLARATVDRERRQAAEEAEDV